MATKLVCATGNFTSSSTWKTASAVSNAYVDSNSSPITITTSNFDSTAFVPAATAIDAVAIKIAVNYQTTGTLTVKIRNSTTSTDTRTVTVNCSDIQSSTSISGGTCVGWYQFSFSSFTPNGTDSYIIRVTRSGTDSSTNRISIMTSGGTAATMSRAVRLTTTSAPAANDQLIFAGELTGAGTSNAYTVTFDNTANTSFGPTVSGGPPEGISFNDKCTLNCGTSASTNYYFRWKGVLKLFAGAVCNWGTSGTKIPSSSTLVFECDSTSNVDTGLEFQNGVTNAGQWLVYGTERAYDWSYLNADASASATSLTMADSVAWNSGDQIAIATSTRTVAQTETFTLGTGSSGTTVTLPSGLAYAHTGTAAGTKAEVINLTRNVKFRGTSITTCGYINMSTGVSSALNSSVLTMNAVECYWLGSATTGKRGIEVQTNSSGSFTRTHCSTHDYFQTASAAYGISFPVAGYSNVNINTEVAYNIAWINVAIVAVGSGVNCGINGFVMIGPCSNGAIYFVDPQWNMSNINISGCTAAFNNAVALNSLVSGSISNIITHGCGQSTINISNRNSGSFTNITGYYNSYGLVATNNVNCTFDTASFTGNTTNNLQLDTNQNCLFTNITANGHATYNTSYGVYFYSAPLGSMVTNSTFGATYKHQTADLVAVAANAYLVCQNCTFSSPTELVTSSSNFYYGNAFSSQRHQGTAGNHKTVKYEGNISVDTTIYNTLSPSQRLTPSSTIFKLRSASVYVPVTNGNTATVQLMVRKSAVGDGTAYNGNQPRLVLRACPAAGINSDTVVATYSAGTGSWNALSGSSSTVTDDAVLEFFIDCDGTAGWINIDDVSASCPNPSGMKYWLNGQPYADAIFIVTPTDVGLTFIGG